MTSIERNQFLLSFLEQVRPIVGKFARDWHIEFDDLFQDASLHLIKLLDADKLDFSLNPRAVVAHYIRFRMINALETLQRRRSKMLSLEASLDDLGESDLTLADLIPSPFYHDPLELVLCQERLEQLGQKIASLRGSHGRAVRFWYDDAMSQAVIA